MTVRVFNAYCLFNRPKIKFMTAPIIEPATLSQTPVFPQTLHRVRPRRAKAAPGQKYPKRDNIFSKSRDTREDRGMRQAKTSHNSKTLFRVAGSR
jgi:hypothetical protein